MASILRIRLKIYFYLLFVDFQTYFVLFFEKFNARIHRMNYFCACLRYLLLKCYCMMNLFENWIDFDLKWIDLNAFIDKFVVGYSLVIAWGICLMIGNLYLSNLGIAIFFVIHQLGQGLESAKDTMIALFCQITLLQGHPVAHPMVLCRFYHMDLEVYSYHWLEVSSPCCPLLFNILITIWLLHYRIIIK